MPHFVYILASRPHGPIYIGTARDLRRRLEQHHASKAGTHADRYRIKTLVYFEAHQTTLEAVHRERRLKRWRRAWKDELIAAVNPEWRDISDQIPL